jgi:hypothetical protein
MTCAGNSSQICGGKSANSVYQSPINKNALNFTQNMGDLSAFF